MFGDIPWNVWRHSPEYNIPPIPRVPRIPFPVPVFLVLYIADKCHLITSSKTPVGIEVPNITIMSEEKVKLLGVYIDNRLNFDHHISQLCKKTRKTCML